MPVKTRVKTRASVRALRARARAVRVRALRARARAVRVRALRARARPAWTYSDNVGACARPVLRVPVSSSTRTDQSNFFLTLFTGILEYIMR